MPSVFTRIIAGELPAQFVWRDEQVVAFLSINPITPGHTLVVPRLEVDHWTDLDPALWAACGEVARIVGRGLQRAYDPPRVGQMIAGFEVPHTHVHVLALTGLGDLDFAKAASDVDPAELAGHADRIRTALRDLGHREHIG